MRQGLSNVINALVRILFLKGCLHGVPTVASFFNAAILSRVWERTTLYRNTPVPVAATVIGLCRLLCMTVFKSNYQAQNFLHILHVVYIICLHITITLRVREAGWVRVVSVYLPL